MNLPTHSKAFVTEMKDRLLQEKASLEQELSALANRHGDDFQSKFPDYGRNEEENATEVADFEATNAATEALEERLEGATAALERIEVGTYGITVDGELIPEDRLRANPSATTVIKK